MTRGTGVVTEVLKNECEGVGVKVVGDKSEGDRGKNKGDRDDSECDRGENKGDRGKRSGEDGAGLVEYSVGANSSSALLSQ